MAYLTPAQGPSLPQLPLGPLTGFMTGMQLDAANQMNQRMLRDDDLQYLINDIRRQSDASNLDVTKAKNQNDVLGQAIIAQQYGSGAKQAQADAAVAADTSGNQAKAVEAQDAIKQSLAVPTVQMADFIRQNGGQLDPTNQAHLDAWKQYSDVLRLHGVKAPDFPDPQQQAALLQKGTSFVNSAAYQQQLGAIKAQGGIQETLHGMDNASHEAVAGTQAAAHVQGAKITAQAGIDREEIRQATARTADQQLNSILQAVAKIPGGFESAPQFVPLARQMAYQKVWNSPTYSIFQTMASMNPGDPAVQQKVKVAQDAARQDAERILREDPTFVKAAKKVDGELQGQGMQPSAPGPAAAPTSGGDKAPAQIKSDEDYNALPSGALFVGPDGKTRRKP